MPDQNRNVGDLIAEANAALELSGRLREKSQGQRVAVALEQHAESLLSRIEVELLCDPETRKRCAGHYVQIKPDKEKPDSLYDVSVQDETGKFVECGKAASMYNGYEVELIVGKNLHDFSGKSPDEIKAQVIDILFPLIPTNVGHGLPQDVNSS